MTPPRLHLRDFGSTLCTAWEEAFRGVTGVDVACADIFSTPADAIVSPANSFGFMDGGIDQAYTNRFGWSLQERLQAQIQDAWSGELPVGAALVVETHEPTFPFMVSAPTMRVPADVSNTVNAYLAFRAALLAVERHNASGKTPIRSIACPGLATLTGCMPAGRCAQQMRQAYEACVHPKPLPARSVLEREHRLMTTASPSP